MSDTFHIAVICCYNDDRILHSMLLPSLSAQKGVEIEQVLIKGEFSSAAEAYNYAIDHTKADYLCFIHQDMSLLDESFLVKAIQEIDKDKEAIYGLCGSVYTKETGITTYSNVWHGLWNCNVGISIEKPVVVKGLDEIMVAFHRDVTKSIRFDEKTFDGWHLFVEDICLQAELLGRKVYVLPFKSQHKNHLEMPEYMHKYGILPKAYFHYLLRARNKYKGRIEIIVCPCFTIKTSFLRFWKAFLLAYFHYARKQRLRKKSI